MGNDQKNETVVKKDVAMVPSYLGDLIRVSALQLKIRTCTHVDYLTGLSDRAISKELNELADQLTRHYKGIASTVDKIITLLDG